MRSGESGHTDLVAHARVALSAAARALPPQRSKYSKKQFDQPQLAAILCLARRAGWSLRQIEIVLRHDRALREALSLSRAPDYTTISRFRGRVGPMVLSRICADASRRLVSTGDDEEPPR